MDKETFKYKDLRDACYHMDMLKTLLHGKIYKKLEMWLLVLDNYPTLDPKGKWIYQWDFNEWIVQHEKNSRVRRDLQAV